MTEKERLVAAIPAEIRTLMDECGLEVGIAYKVSGGSHFLSSVVCYVLKGQTEAGLNIGCPSIVIPEGKEGDLGVWLHETIDMVRRFDPIRQANNRLGLDGKPYDSYAREFYGRDELSAFNLMNDFIFFKSRALKELSDGCAAILDSQEHPSPFDGPTNPSPAYHGHDRESAQIGRSAETDANRRIR